MSAASDVSGFIIVLCGLPGAGKTTFARHVVEHAESAWTQGKDMFSMSCHSHTRLRYNLCLSIYVYA